VIASRQGLPFPPRSGGNAALAQLSKPAWPAQRPRRCHHRPDLAGVEAGPPAARGGGCMSAEKSSTQIGRPGSSPTQAPQARRCGPVPRRRPGHRRPRVKRQGQKGREAWATRQPRWRPTSRWLITASALPGIHPIALGGRPAQGVAAGASSGKPGHHHAIAVASSERRRSRRAAGIGGHSSGPQLNAAGPSATGSPDGLIGGHQPVRSRGPRVARQASATCRCAVATPGSIAAVQEQAQTLLAQPGARQGRRWQSDRAPSPPRSGAGSLPVEGGPIPSHSDGLIRQPLARPSKPRCRQASPANRRSGTDPGRDSNSRVGRGAARGQGTAAPPRCAPAPTQARHRAAGSAP